MDLLLKRVLGLVERAFDLGWWASVVK